VRDGVQGTNRVVRGTDGARIAVAIGELTELFHDK